MLIGDRDQYAGGAFFRVASIVMWETEIIGHSGVKETLTRTANGNFIIAGLPFGGSGVNR
jgi:hypothetical protein